MNRILILDDDQAVLNCFETLLAQAGRFEIEVLADSTQAVRPARVEAVRPDAARHGHAGRARAWTCCGTSGNTTPASTVMVITGVGDVELAVESMKLGAYDYLCKPVESGDCVTLHRPRARAARDAARSCSGSRRAVNQRACASRRPSRTSSPRTRSCCARSATVEQIALSDNNVLIWGESGTGKELVARAIHQLGRRAGKPFIAVNAAAFASSLFDSQFFGHERGAFTGADTSKQGMFEEADGGTLFLDEIGEIELGGPGQAAARPAVRRVLPARLDAAARRRRARSSPPRTRTSTRDRGRAASGATCTTG